MFIIVQCEFVIFQYNASFIGQCKSRPPSLREQHDYQSPSGTTRAATLCIRHRDNRQPGPVQRGQGQPGAGKTGQQGQGMENMQQLSSE